MATKVEEAYQKYLYYHNNHPVIHSNRFDILSKSEFLDKICYDKQFYIDWGNKCLGDLPPTSKKVKYDMTVKTDPVVAELPVKLVNAGLYGVVEPTKPFDFNIDKAEFEIKKQVIKKISNWALFKLHLHSIKYKICKQLGLDKNSRMK